MSGPAPEAEGWTRRILPVAVVTMLVQQSFAYMATLVLPVAAPAISRDLGLDPALVGAYSGILFTASVMSSVNCGPFIERFGALRMSQFALASMALGLTLPATGMVALFAVSAFLVGAGTAYGAPAGSHVLAKYATPRQAPLAFSIKQTGVPMGGILAGLMVPFFVGATGWAGAFLAAAAICVVTGLALQPLRARFDDDRQPGKRISPAEVVATYRIVFAKRELVELGLASFAFVGLQVIFASFFVLYMVEGLGRDLASAGWVFSLSQAVAIPARILWGWLAGNVVAPRLMLAALGTVMAVTAVVTGLFAADWPIWVIALVAAAYSATAISWHGVYLSEVARHAPPGQVGRVTGGVMAFTGASQLIYPALFGILLTVTGSYAIGFQLAALPAAAIAVLFLVRHRAARVAADIA